MTTKNKTQKTEKPAKKEVFYQQGDVLLFRTDDIPSNAKPRDNGVVAYGEVTGHSHKMKGKAKVLVSKKKGKKSEEIFVKVDKASNIEHEEHNSLKIPKGNYKVKIVRERNHFTAATSAVRD